MGGRYGCRIATGPTTAAKRPGRAKRRNAARKLAAEVVVQPCGATKRNGKPCGRDAGWGTDHPGSGQCKHHGGCTQNGKVGAARGEAQGMAVSIEVSPGQAMLGVLHLAAGQLQYTTEKVAELTEDQLFEDGGLNRWLRLQRTSMHDLAKFAKLAADAGINERMADLAEQQTSMVSQLMEAVLADLDLSAKQRKQVGPAIRRHLVALPGGQSG